MPQQPVPNIPVPAPLTIPATLQRVNPPVVTPNTTPFANSGGTIDVPVPPTVLGNFEIVIDGEDLFLVAQSLAGLVTQILAQNAVIAANAAASA
jgi:hypothetical protein